MPLYFLIRSVRILVLTLVFLVAFVPAGLLRKPAAPVILRRYLQASGGVFLKLGQFLAMRYDLLPPPWCQELSRLLDRLPPVPVSAIIPVIERDIGRPVSEAFASFDPVALGSASLAQVHQATLSGGDVVVVKVMRPGTERRFRIDLLYLRFYAWALSFMPFLNPGVPGILGEMVALTRAELDFRREARNVREMHETLLTDDIDHYAPRLYPALCGANTVTMEHIEGVPVSDLLRAIDERDHAQLAAWAEIGITPRRTARLILRSVLEQTMHHRVFQADPHASNMIVMPGGTLAWVDFGVLGWLDERLWQQQLWLREAIAGNHVHRAVGVVISMFPTVSRARLAPFEAEVKDYLRDWLRASRDPTSTIAEKSSGLFFLNVMRAAQRSGMRIPSGLTSLFRTIIVADVIMFRLDPLLDWQPSVRGFIQEEQERQMATLVRDSVSLAYAGKLAQITFGAVPTLLTAIELLQTALPKVDRALNDDLSRLETSLVLVLRVSRLGFVALAVGAFGALIAEVTEVPGIMLLLAGTGTLAAFVLTRLIRLYR